MRMETRVIEDGKYQVHYRASGNAWGTGEKATVEHDAVVEFSHDPQDYGNGYYMGIEGKGEAFGFSCIDVRYDTDFHPQKKVQYITDYFTKRYAGGWDGSWNLDSITVTRIQ